MVCIRAIESQTAECRICYKERSVAHEIADVERLAKVHFYMVFDLGCCAKSIIDLIFPFLVDAKLPPGLTLDHMHIRTFTKEFDRFLLTCKQAKRAISLIKPSCTNYTNIAHTTIYLESL